MNVNKQKMELLQVFEDEKLYQTRESDLQVPWEGLSYSYLIICYCSFAFWRRLSSYKAFSFSTLDLSSFFFFIDYYALVEISSRKYFNLLDQYFSFPKFSQSLLTSPGFCSFFIMKSLELPLFLTVGLTSFQSQLFFTAGLQKEIDFFKIDLSFGSGMFTLIASIIYSIRFYKGFDIGAISERLKAAIILTISKRLVQLLLRFYYLTYSSKQLEIILKSSIFYLSFSLKSGEDFLRLVFIELPLFFDQSTFLVRLMTLIVCFVFFLLFLRSKLLVFLNFPLLNLEAEWFYLTKLIQGVQCYAFNTETGSFSSVFNLTY